MKPSRANYLKRALSLMSTPYLWGGRTHKGVDCFGMVALALKEASEDAVDLRAWWTDKAWAELPATDSPLPGDLIFYGGESDTDVEHVMVLLVPEGPAASGGVIFGASGGGKANTTVEYSMAKGHGVQVKTSIYYRGDFRGFRSLAPFLAEGLA